MFFCHYISIFIPRCSIATFSLIPEDATFSEACVVHLGVCVVRELSMAGTIQWSTIRWLCFWICCVQPARRRTTQ